MLAELLFITFPKLHSLSTLYDAFQVFIDWINPSLIDHAGYSLWSKAIFYAILIWLSSYVALEAFARKTDGVSLWRDIKLDSCGRASQGARNSLCTAIKWTLTVFSAPFLVIAAYLQRWRTNTQNVTIGFITVNPDALIGYLKHLMLASAFLITLVALAKGILI